MIQVRRNAILVGRDMILVGRDGDEAREGRETVWECVTYEERKGRGT